MSSRGDWRGGSEPYWRRRVLLLAGVIGVTGLVMWGCSSTAGLAPSASRSAPDAATQQLSASAAPTATATATAASRATPPGRTPGTHRLTAHERAARKRAAHQRSGKSQPAPTHPGAAAAASARGTCAAASLVISLTESQSSYPPGTQPQFTVYVVNTGPRTCTLNASPRSLRLNVESGPVHSWSPADCAGRPRPDLARLARGVPLVQHISWNRVRSQPGCPMPRAAALPGTYTVRVSAGLAHSQTDVFLLR